METQIKGIKCDNPDCDFRDETVKWDDYEKTVSEWLNKPCPKCGANLLTQESVDSTKRMLFVMEEMDKIVREVSPPNDEEQDAPININTSPEGHQSVSLDKFSFELTPEMLIQLEILLKSSEGREMIKQQIRAQSN